MHGCLVIGAIGVGGGYLKLALLTNAHLQQGLFQHGHDMRPARYNLVWHPAGIVKNSPVGKCAFVEKSNLCHHPKPDLNLTGQRFG